MLEEKCLFTNTRLRVWTPVTSSHRSNSFIILFMLANLSYADKWTQVIIKPAFCHVAYP